MLGLFLSLLLTFPAQAQEEQAVVEQPAASQEAPAVKPAVKPAKKNRRALRHPQKKNKSAVAPAKPVQKKAAVEKAPAVNPFSPVPPTPFEPSNP